MESNKNIFLYHQLCTRREKVLLKTSCGRNGLPGLLFVCVYIYFERWKSLFWLSIKGRAYDGLFSSSCARLKYLEGSGKMIDGLCCGVGNGIWNMFNENSLCGPCVDQWRAVSPPCSSGPRSERRGPELRLVNNLLLSWKLENEPEGVTILIGSIFYWCFLVRNIIFKAFIFSKN